MIPLKRCSGSDMDIFRLSVFCITACIMLRLLSAVNPETKSLGLLLAVCIAGGHFLADFSEIAEAAGNMFEQTGLDESYLAIVFKSLGICYVTQISSDCCRDNGDNALASQLELAGKAALIITGLPMLSAAADIIRSLLVM